MPPNNKILQTRPLELQLDSRISPIIACAHQARSYARSYPGMHAVDRKSRRHLLGLDI
jgi:hypothetical protein